MSDITAIPFEVRLRLYQETRRRLTAELHVPWAMSAPSASSPATENSSPATVASPDEELICRVCAILKQPHHTFSHEDVLKDHIETLHKEFKDVLNREDIDILRPKQIDEEEDLMPLVKICWWMQTESAYKKKGKEIPADLDLSLLYPEVLSSVVAELGPL